jgi:hypothetical protein
MYCYCCALLEQQYDEVHELILTGTAGNQLIFMLLSFVKQRTLIYGNKLCFDYT